MAVSGEILPPPRPKSPPGYPELCGKRRELAKVLMLERQISLLEEEMKYVDGLQRSSSSCKEVADFISEKSDALIPVNHKVLRRNCFWNWLCGKSSRSRSWFCCCGNGTTTTTEHNHQCKLQSCCCRNGCSFQCKSLPCWQCCFGKSSCNCCCSFQCSNSGCCKWKCCFRCFSKIKKCLCCTDNKCCCNFSSCC